MKDWRDFSIRGEFEAREMAWAEAARDRAYRYGMEASGVSVPWIAQFFPELVPGHSETAKRRRDSDAQSIATLLTAQFERLWAATMAGLGDLAGRVEALAETITDRLADVEQALNDLQCRTVTLKDGTRIYPDRDGNWRGEDGSVIDLEAAGLRHDDLPDGPGTSGASWEEFSALRDQRDAFMQAERRAEEIGVDIGGLQDRAHDAQERQDMDALNEIGRELGDLDAEIGRLESDILSQDIVRSISVPAYAADMSKITISDVPSSFEFDFGR